MSIMRHFDRLCSLRDQLEAKLLLHEERHCFGDGEMDDGTAWEIRTQIAELSDEIATLLHKPVAAHF